MAISYNSGADYTIGASVPAIASGTDRLLIIAAFVGGGEALGTVSLGSQVATQIVVEDSTGDLTALFYIKDADIPSGSNTLTCSGTVTNEDIAIELFEGVDQTNPIASSGGATSGGTIALSGITGVSGGAAFSLCGHSDSIFPTQTNYTASINLQGSFSNRGATAYKLLTDTADNPTTWTVSTANRSATWAVLAPSSGSFGIDSTDASMQRNGTFDVTFSNPATTPTTGNTSLSQGGDTLTCTGITGSDPYTATFSVGDLSKQVDATGYDWTLTVDAETDTTGNIPLTIQSGWTKVDLVSPVTTNASLLFGVSGDTPVTGDDLEYDVTSTLDSGVSFSVATDGVWTVTEAVEGDWVTDITVDRRVVQADGTIGTTATLTLSASTGTASIGGGIVTAMVSPMVSNMISNMVN